MFRRSPTPTRSAAGDTATALGDEPRLTCEYLQLVFFLDFDRPLCARVGRVAPRGRDSRMRLLAQLHQDREGFGSTTAELERLLQEL